MLSKIYVVAVLVTLMVLEYLLFFGNYSIMNYFKTTDAIEEVQKNVEEKKERNDVLKMQIDALQSEEELRKIEEEKLEDRES